MPSPRHLAAAPIVEAVIDIQVKTPTGTAISAFRKLADRFGVNQRIEEIHTVAVEMVQHPGLPLTQKSASMGAIGFRCFSKDEKVIVQFRKNGFSFSRMAPYSSWEEIFPRAGEMYAAYHAAVKPEEVSRIAVRNINRLLIPSLRLAGNAASFFTCPPLTLNSEIALTDKWMTRLLVKHPSKRIQALLTQLVEDETIGDKTPVILDFDVFDVSSLPLEATELLARFAQLREWKNQLFFGSLTEEMLALLK